MRMWFFIFSVLFLIFPAQAQTTSTGASVFEASGLPIPRFVSLKSDKVFVRTGPALRYPIKWIYQKQGLPVEVVQEFDTWRKIRDHEGEEGWIHQSLLSGRRSVLVATAEGVSLLRRQDEPEHKVVTLEPNVVARLIRCETSLCEVSVQGYQGWGPRNSFWGIYATEELQ